ncbi:MAG: hypothetical protein V4525_08930 [Pseudomonadota bacterium]
MKAVKIIFIAQTGWGQEEHRQRSLVAGFHHHLTKPVDLNVLEELLARSNSIGVKKT